MQAAAAGHAPGAGEEVVVSTVGRIAPWMMGLLAVVLSAPADAQNIDAGKSPAQIFADTCSACHRRPQELKRTSAGFLRSHYTTGQDEAAAMASYLAAIPPDPRANQQRRQPGPGPTPPETIPLRRQEQSKEQPKEQAKSQQAPVGASKGRRPASAEAKAPAPAAATPAPEARPSEPPPEPAPPPLEDFEE
jgi:hypothetical protein